MSICVYYSDSELVNRQKNRRALKNLYLKMNKKKEMFGIGDGSVPKKDTRKFNKMKIKEEMKLDLKLAPSHSGSDRSRFKLYTIEEVSENSSQSESSNHRMRIERDAEIQRVIEENKKLGMNRPRSAHAKIKPLIEVRTLKPVTSNPSEESVMASVFKEGPNNDVDQKSIEFDADQKIAQLDAAMEEILDYKHSQIHRLSDSSFYEYHKQKQMLRQNMDKTSSMVVQTTSTTSSLLSHKTTSCFGKLFCPSKKSRR